MQIHNTRGTVRPMALFSIYEVIEQPQKPLQKIIIVKNFVENVIQAKLLIQNGKSHQVGDIARYSVCADIRHFITCPYHELEFTIVHRFRCNLKKVLSPIQRLRDFSSFTGVTWLLP